jgi:pimeloyl-ACP methyl ester carboxylesterase
MERMGTTTGTVRSADGTAIAFDRTGDGPPLVVVLGAFNDRRSKPELVDLLAAHFTVYAYDRRGRGGSGDTPPYAVEREIEDLSAVIAAAGGSARVFGHSSGAVLSLQAAAAEGPTAAARDDVGIERLALYDAPVTTSEAPAPASTDVLQRVRAEVAAGRPAEACKLFLVEVVGMPAEMVTMVGQSPHWDGMVAMAHTLPYDLELASTPVPPDRLAAVRAPTLAVAGGAGAESMVTTARVVAESVVDGRHLVLDGQTHDEDPAVLAPVLVEFLS